MFLMKLFKRITDKINEIESISNTSSTDKDEIQNNSNFLEKQKICLTAQDGKSAWQEAVGVFEEQEKLAVSMGQVFNMKKNADMPAKSSLDQKMSDVVGEINYNFSKMGTIGYKFSLDHNFNDLNYNEVSTSLNFGKINFNLEYLDAFLKLHYFQKVFLFF